MKVCQLAMSELSDLSQLIAVVKDYAHLKRIPQRAAYIDIKTARENGTPLWEKNWDDRASTQSSNHEGYPGVDGEEDDFEEIFADFFEHVMGESGDQTFSGHDDHNGHFSRGYSRQSSAGSNRSQTKDHSAQEYLKTIYRKLVRILHPDAGTGIEVKQRQLWQEVQDAYRWRDVQRLEAILIQVTGDKQGVLDLKAVPISQIMDLRRDVEKRLRSLKTRIASARRETAWEFRLLKSKKQQLTVLKKELIFDLESDLREIKSELAHCQRQIKTWEKPAPVKKKPQVQKKKSSSEGGVYASAYRKDSYHKGWIFDE